MKSNSLFTAINKLKSKFYNKYIVFKKSDFSVKNAIKSNYFYTIVDKTTELLENDNQLETSAQFLPPINGIGKYMRNIYINSYGVSLYYDQELWANSSFKNTPFWLAVRNCEWKTDKHIENYLSLIDDTNKATIFSVTYLAITPILNVSMEQVAMDIKEQILNVLTKTEK